jgi:hypothetical protein
VSQAEELAAAKGVELPADFVEAAAGEGLRLSALQAYFALQVTTSLCMQMCSSCPYTLLTVPPLAPCHAISIYDRGTLELKHADKCCYAHRALSW